MSYLVLARKWRPKSFEQMVGQKHILTIMSNSLSQNKIHHAYLYCGTRGVGKTTLARIFAKCLNCQAGVTTTPCNQCDTCKQIDNGSFPDLIEIDAASRTKVEDTRELLDNVQYAPTAGRYKVYLIDEVHMLSGHSFNALLKTLEEPPEHVKFLLATTDPQKLPITVLSRCLKLQLKMLNITEIKDHLAHVLNQENIEFEPNALTEIAKAAKGSMRDALSLLDQAIVYCQQPINFEQVCEMLGTTSALFSFELLTAIAEQDINKALDTVKQMEDKSCDLIQATDHLLQTLYHIALYQADPNTLALNNNSDEANQLENIKQLAKQFQSEDTQLLYQICLQGKQDMPFAPSLRVGFEMLLLKLAQFYPLDFTAAPQANNPSSPNTRPRLTPEHKRNTNSQQPPRQQPCGTNKSSPTESSNNSHNHLHNSSLANSSKINLNAENWPEVIKSLNIGGMTQMLANQCSIANLTDSILELRVSEKHKTLCNPKQQQILSEALKNYLGNNSLTINFSIGSHIQAPPQEQQNQKKAEKQQAAVEKLNKDPNIQQLINMFDADISETVIEE